MEIENDNCESFLELVRNGDLNEIIVEKINLNSDFDVNYRGI